MRPICALLGALAFLSVAMSAAQAELRDRAGALDWQTFKVPEYGTRVEYARTLKPHTTCWHLS
jgi:hypothetical protein